MSNARTGFGTAFKLGNGAEPSVLTAIGEMISIDPGADTFGTTETTHFGSPQRRREYLKTLIEGGNGSFAVNWEPGVASDVMLQDAVDDPGSRPYTITVPDDDDGAWEISGTVLVLSRTPTISLDDRMTCNISLQFTGARTEAAAA